MKAKIDENLDNSKDVIEKEKVVDTSLIDIFRYIKPEIKRYLLVGIFCVIIWGMNYPICSILYGRIFKVSFSIFNSTK